VEVQGEEEKPMRAVSLLYHDVVRRGAADDSGFPGLQAARYKIDREDFEAHVAALHAAVPSGPGTVRDVLDGHAGEPFMLTFDDGGVSATAAADVLDRYGWKGHFFVTTNYIGHPTFVTTGQIRALRDRGHAIGTHSRSHPPRMSHLAWDEMIAEWRGSVEALSDVLGEPVAIASVPGGYHSAAVARAASESGIRALFTSEPVTRSHVVDRCRVFGRYTVWRGMDPRVSAGFATGRGSARIRQFAFWNSKKVAKRLGGRQYANLVGHLLKRLDPDERAG
jgi:peptidoglycan/xylan/chitin deacetylase (PgdA/CDA1 family)